MSHPARLALSVAAFFGAWLLIFFLSLMVLPESLHWLQPLGALGFAIWAARRVWLQLEDVAATGLPVFVGTGALMLGGLGFVLGFFGPMVFAPEANQGPLLGIFITGPGGAALGAVTGWLVWLKRRG
ncbi:MAG: multidrug ABC transporter permease [Thiobacillus sp.]|nr:multidrug ABC transporter permease [Thiobacillus sp.]